MEDQFEGADPEVVALWKWHLGGMIKKVQNYLLEPISRSMLERAKTAAIGRFPVQE